MTVRPGGAELTEPESYDRPPPGRRLSGAEALRVAEAVPRVRAAREEHPRAYARAYLTRTDDWQVSLYVPPPPGERAARRSPRC